MSEQSFNIEATLSKEERYIKFISIFKHFCQSDDDVISLLANTTAALKECFCFFWVGFYLVKNDELILGPFQGSVACTKIKKSRGVCGTAWCEQRTIIVQNVNDFPGHIACSSLSQSEIVVPMCLNEQVIGVLDVDSDRLNDFDAIDQKYLEIIVDYLLNFVPNCSKSSPFLFADI